MIKWTSIWLFAAPLLAGGGAARLYAVEDHSAPSSRPIELIRDPHFARGFQLYDPAPGKKTVVASLTWDGPSAATGDPIWGMAQWSSKHSLAGAKAERLASGTVRFANVAKTVIVGPPGSDDADLVLGMDSRQEWGDHARQKNEKWPHLLVEQRLEGCPPLTQLAALGFHVEARLRHAEQFPPPGYDRQLHAAHFLIHFTVQNLNKASKGFGDFLWLGVPVYDDRDRVPRKHVAGDAASGKLIYCLAGDAFTSDSLQDGRWVTLERDMLPLALAGLREARNRGFLKGSQDPSDYRLGSMNMGWEVTGINKIELQVRNLSLRAIKTDGE